MTYDEPTETLITALEVVAHGNPVSVAPEEHSTIAANALEYYYKNNKEGRKNYEDRKSKDKRPNTSNV